jgi:hypothetical protein
MKICNYQNQCKIVITVIWTNNLEVHKYKLLNKNLLLLLLLTAVDLSLGSSSPYTSTDKTNKNKYT